MEYINCKITAVELHVPYSLFIESASYQEVLCYNVMYFNLQLNMNKLLTISY